VSPANVERTVLAALVVTESAWLYAVFAVIGIALGSEGALLGWTGVVGVLAASVAAARALQAVALPMWARYAGQMGAGALTVYLVMATQVTGGQQMFDLGWVGTLLSDGGDGQYILRGMLGSVFAIALWWRGGRIAASEIVTESLSFSFRLGAFVMALAVIVDVVSDTSLNTFAMLFLFFAAALAGLGVGRLAPDSERAGGVGPWLKVLAALVAAILLLGLLFTLLSKDELAVVSGPIGWVMGWIGKGIFFAFILPVSYVVNAVIGLIARSLRREGSSAPTEAPGSFGEQFLQRPDAATPAYVTVIEWLLLALLVAGVLYLLARAFQRRRSVRYIASEGMRESVREGADPGSDLAEALFDLLPSFLRRRHSKRKVALPDGPPGVVEAIRQYYRMLFWAEGHGTARAAFETPAEYASRAAPKLPDTPVDDATGVFDAAYYGGQVPDGPLVDEIRAKLDHVGAPDVT